MKEREGMNGRGGKELGKRNGSVCHTGRGRIK